MERREERSRRYILYLLCVVRHVLVLFNEKKKHSTVDRLGDVKVREKTAIVRCGGSL